LKALNSSSVVEDQATAEKKTWQCCAKQGFIQLPATALALVATWK